MSNDYYERKAEFKPFTTARSDDVRGEFDGIQSGFEKLPTPRQDGTKGFITAFTIVNPTEDNHPATKAMVAAENSKNTEQDGRLEQVENTLSGLGPVNGRYTTLRYVATEGQDTIVLPAQFGSLAYVFVNGARKFQTVHFVYDVNTKTLTFLSALSLNDEVLVDVGVVPDAVLADLIAIQNDIASKHSDVHTWHSDVEQWQQEVASNTQTAVDAKDTAVAAKNETVASRNVVVALFLGPKAAAPTLDNDGNPLTEGACYYNTTDGKTYVWVSGGWEVTNLSSSTTVAKSSLTGAALIPKGTTGERPDPASLPDNVMALRYNSETEEWEGEDSEGNYSTIGGGGATKPTYVNANTVAKKNKYYVFDMADNTSKVLILDTSLIDGNFVSVSLKNWSGDLSKNVVIEPDPSWEWDYEAYEINQGASLVVKGNQVVTIQVTDGKLKIQAEAGSKSPTIKRGKTTLWDYAISGTNGVEAFLVSPIGFDDVRIEGYWLTGSVKFWTSLTLSAEEFLALTTSSERADVVNFTETGTSADRTIRWIHSVSESGFSIMHTSQTLTSLITKVIGIKY